MESLFHAFVSSCTVQYIYLHWDVKVIQLGGCIQLAVNELYYVLRCDGVCVCGGGGGGRCNHLTISD